MEQAAAALQRDPGGDEQRGDRAELDGEAAAAPDDALWTGATLGRPHPVTAAIGDPAGAMTSRRRTERG